MKRYLDVYVEFHQLPAFKAMIESMRQCVETTSGLIRWLHGETEDYEIRIIWQLRTSLDPLHLRDTLRAMGIEAQDFHPAEAEGCTWSHGLASIDGIEMP